LPGQAHGREGARPAQSRQPGPRGGEVDASVAWRHEVISAGTGGWANTNRTHVGGVRGSLPPDWNVSGRR
jgi:hypothetical protein